MEQVIGMTTGTNQVIGLKIEIVLGMVIVTNLRRDMEEAIDGKTTIVRQKDTKKGMIAKIGERIIIEGGTTTPEMIIQEKEGVKKEKEGVKNKRRFLGTIRRRTKEKKEALKETATELPHASCVVNQAAMQETAQRNSKI